MAQLVTWDEFTSAQNKGGTIAEIVVPEVIDMISRDRPVMGILGNAVAEGLYIERLEDVLGPRVPNAFPEGVTATDPALSQPARLGFTVQRFAKWGQMSDEQRDTLHYNGDPWSYQAGKKMEELLNDVEHALTRQTVVSGASGVARQFEGLLHVANFAGTQTFQTNASGTTFTEREFINRLQAFKDAKFATKPRVALVNTWLKRTISLFSTKNTFNVEAGSKFQTLIVDRHASDFGTIDIFYSEDQLAATTITGIGNSFLCLDPDFFKKAWFKAPTFEKLARDGFRDRFQMTTQLTLTYGSRKAIGGGLGYVANIPVT